MLSTALEGSNVAEHIPSTGRFYGGMGLAILIADLATHRVRPKGSCRISLDEEYSGPLPREEAFSDDWFASQEYYNICDRIARGERP